MVRFGLDLFTRDIPAPLKGKKIGLVCHAASITSMYIHAIDVLLKHPGCKLAAIFGPQHGLYGQTQDNMVEWEGGIDPVLGIPVFSLYGKVRKPASYMLEGIDALVFDVQDVGARPYTYVWTLKLCMEACLEKGIAVWVLDRPNPVGCLRVDGPMLSPEYFSFVGGAEIPLCHRLTMGELALQLRNKYYPSLELEIVWMENWWRNSFWSETGLPWVFPSPNMPTPETALVYPGMVLLEATNLSEGRGTTRPFEIFGAPYIDIRQFKELLSEQMLNGCVFREHGFIPTFQKWQGMHCSGMQIHITNPRSYSPVLTTAVILSAALKASAGEFKFKDPPYEYELEKMPFDILAGDSELRESLEKGVKVEDLQFKWRKGHEKYRGIFDSVAHYPEERS